MTELATSSLKPDSEKLFAYTSGRYLFNEKLRLAEKYVLFNVAALKKVVANSSIDRRLCK